MKTISKDDIETIATGSSILGVGGGGDPYLGKLLAQQAIEKYGDVSLIPVEELDDDALVMTVALFGSPLILVEKLLAGNEFIKAFEILENYLGKKVDAVMPIEAGGINGTIPFVVAAQKQLPLVDADGMGRAFPCLEMVTFTLHGLLASPFVITDEKGNQAIYEAIDNLWGESFIRAAVMQMGGTCGIGSYSMTAKQVKQSAILGITSYAQSLGEAIQDSKKNNQSPVEALTKKANAIKLFTGKIHNITQKTDGRFNKGVCEIMGLEEDSGSQMVLDFQNEFLIAKKDGALAAITPDLIALIDAENAAPITAESIQYGTRVIVLGMKSNQQWRTPKGIEVVGPEKFGYQEKFVPIEKLNPSLN